MGLSFVYFFPFLNTLTNIVQNLTLYGRTIDGVLGMQTWDSRMVCKYESIEQWRPLIAYTCSASLYILYP